ncbi:hypothetical protein [Clostridium sp. JS66]|uniref:hypothetical protein n=1 Tax=Clostridium sp. JS66 TaxID=3064705 RepID=UPI00298DAB99|nr:hypothetical protein [Clostridium sp. JS66]WPC43525.1 hypothetical protein Q6H37_08650 [Clostridium sp. JS66]
MSAFLAPIHTWLYKKIKFQDELIKRIRNFVSQKGYEDELLSQLDHRCGTLEEGELADIIDENNIHGWLQEKITVVENRLTFLITIVTDGHPERIKDINCAVYKFGREHSVQRGISIKEAYDYLDNLLLNGMPCDRVNEVTNEDENSIIWNQTVDIHKSYWDMIHGNVDYYYAIRESLIVGIMENSGIVYDQIDEQTFELRKES